MFDVAFQADQVVGALQRGFVHGVCRVTKRAFFAGFSPAAIARAPASCLYGFLWSRIARLLG